MKVLHHILGKIMLSLVVLLNLGMAFVAYLIFFHIEEPLTYPNGHFTSTKEEYVAGEDLIIFGSYCKHTNAPAQVARRFTNGIVYNVPTINTGGGGKGCYEDVLIPTHIPDNLPTGEYQLETIVTYQVNPFAKRTVRVKTNKFKVINNK